MDHLRRSACRVVKILTHIALPLLAGCAYVDRHFQESCKSRAYLQTELDGYLKARFPSKAPVRIGVIPFSAPANISLYDNEYPGIGNEMAWRIHAELLRSGRIPIVEVLNRQDWPRKKEEFFTGNFGGIAMAREAGYDLLLIGHIEPMRSIDSISAYSRVIEAESGTSIWYGKTSVSTARKDLEEMKASLGLTDRRPDLLYTNEMVDKLAHCIVREVLKDRTVP